MIISCGVTENNYGSYTKYGWFIKTEKDTYFSAQWQYAFKEYARKALAKTILRQNWENK